MYYRNKAHRQPYLSKSRLISAWQCPKKLHLEAHHRELGVITASCRKGRIGIAQLLDDANMFLWKLILAISFGILLAMVFRWLPSE